MPALFNDEALVPALERLGIPTPHARDYTNDGCWEVIIPGRTNFVFQRLSLLLCLEWALNRGRSRLDASEQGPDTGDPRGFETFDDVWDAFLTQMDAMVGRVVQRVVDTLDDRSTIAPVPLLSALIQGCVASRRDMTAGGSRFRTFGMLAESAAHAIDSLVAIKTVVFDRREATVGGLCDALAAIGLLEKEGKTYRNSPLALEYLLPEAPHSKIALLRHAARMYETWGKLVDAVKSGQPVPEEAIDPRLRGDERDFALAMADVARDSARQCAEILDLSDTRNVLDVGGGPGMYAIEFARQNPELHVVVFDNEKTTDVARANIEAAGLSDRISLRVGDAFTDDLGSGYDFVLLSNIIPVSYTHLTLPTN